MPDDLIPGEVYRPPGYSHVPRSYRRLERVASSATGCWPRSTAAPEVLVGDLASTLSCDHSAVAALGAGHINGRRSAGRGSGWWSPRRPWSACWPSKRSRPAGACLPLTGGGHRDRGYCGHSGARGDRSYRRQRDGRRQRAPPELRPEITPAVLWQFLDALGDGLLLVAHYRDDRRWPTGGVRRCSATEREELTGLPVEALVPADLRVHAPGLPDRISNEAPEARPMAERSRFAALRKDGATVPVEDQPEPGADRLGDVRPRGDP